MDPMGSQIFRLSGALFARPSWLSGAARVFDVTGSFDEYNVSSTPVQADQIATKCDWLIVGADLWEAAAAVSEQQPEYAAKRQA